jgi:hypothetical protein
MNGEITTKTNMINNYMKPVSAGLIAFSLDYATGNQSNLESSAIFAGIVGLGSLLGSLVTERVELPVFIPSVNGYTGKQFEVKAVEIVGTFGAAYGVDYVLRNGRDFQRYELTRKALIVAASEVLSETLSEAIIINTKMA